MTEQAPKSRGEIVNELLAEKGLWQVYWRSRSIPFSKTNNIIGIILGISLGVATCWSKDLVIALDHIAALSTVVFNTTVSLLGFLLAGFAFFATVADKTMFCRMAEVTHEQSGMSYLKYNLFVFMRVFVEYLVLCIVALVLMSSLQTGSSSRTCISWLLSLVAFPNPVRTPIWVASCVLGLLFGTFAYLLMQLKSFIFNIYHVVMTSIGWTLENEPGPDDESA